MAAVANAGLLIVTTSRSHCAVTATGRASELIRPAIASAVALEDASTTKKGIVQLSSATNSTSESLAATPKAVKAAYDLAIGAHTHSVAIGSHGHTITVNAAGNAENTVKNIAFNYIVRLA
ncbi:phage tail protein [Escherichia coli]